MKKEKIDWKKYVRGWIKNNQRLVISPTMIGYELALLNNKKYLWTEYFKTQSQALKFAQSYMRKNGKNSN
jgi:hypothetical protein